MSTTSNTLFPSGIPESAEDVKSLAMKDRWINILIQLSASERFQDFINKNYKIIDSVDHSDKTIDTMVVESPISFGPPLDMSQIAAIRATLGKTKNANKIVEKILMILGQEDTSSIEVVSSLDIK